MYTVFKASVENVKELKKQRKNLKRLFNQSIKRNDKSSFEVLTKLYSLLYSTFAEVCFLKIINTPYGFDDDKIKQIKVEVIDGRIRERSLEQKWTKCLELSFNETTTLVNDGEIQNKKQQLSRLINEYIIKPSQLRNKIAHGQWKIALNSKNTETNQETTQKINELDFIKIDILFSVYEKISQAVEDLIESPRKAHFNDFYRHMAELYELINKTKTWSLESKIKVIKEKFERIKNIKNNNESSH